MPTAFFINELFISKFSELSKKGTRFLFNFLKKSFKSTEISNIFAFQVTSLIHTYFGVFVHLRSNIKGNNEHSVKTEFALN